MVRKTGEILAQEMNETDDKEDENALLGKLRDVLQTETGEARMMLLGDRYRVIFPKNYDNQPEMVQIYSTFLTNATLDDMSWERGKIGEETIGENRYLLYYLNLEERDGENNQKIRHIILYCPIHVARHRLPGIPGAFGEEVRQGGRAGAHLLHHGPGPGHLEAAGGRGGL